MILLRRAAASSITALMFTRFMRPSTFAPVLALCCACGADPDETTAGSSTGAASDASSTGAATVPSSSTGAEVPTTGGTSEGSGTTGAAEDIDMQPGDFTCILEWDKVRKFRITNMLGHKDETLAVAADPGNGPYPVGTVIQLIPNEAMVKRAPGFAPDNSDWEFFALETSADGTTIMARGTKDVINGFGGNCFGCHAQAEAKWDRVCEEGHGCDPLPLTPDQIDKVQMGDPRCK